MKERCCVFFFVADGQGSTSNSGKINFQDDERLRRSFDPSKRGMFFFAMEHCAHTLRTMSGGDLQYTACTGVLNPRSI